MAAPVHRQINAALVQSKGAVYTFGIDDQEILDFTVLFADAFASTATSFAINGTVDYGSFTQALAPVVDATNKTITVYIAGIAAGSSSTITVKAQAATDTTQIIEIPFVLTARDSSSQLPAPVAAAGYYATGADMTIVKAAGTVTAISANVSVTQTAPIFVFRAPAACTLTYAAMNVTTTIATNDTNYWSVELRRYRSGSTAAIATKTTQVTGGEAMTAGTLWELTGLDSSNKVLAAGDLVAFFCTRFTSASGLINPQYILAYTLT